MEEQQRRRQRYSNNKACVLFTIFVYKVKKIISICTYLRDRKQNPKMYPSYFLICFHFCDTLESALHSHSTA